MKYFPKHILYFLSLLISLSACQGKAPKWKIGVAQCSDDEWRSQMNEEINREILFHDNIAFEIRCANDSNERQIKDIEYFLDNDFDIIIVAPNEAEALTPAVRNAFSKGIPIVVFDRAVNDSSFTTYIELDNAGIGRNAALYAANSLSRSGGLAMEITGLPGSSPAEERHRGFIEVADSLSVIQLAGSFHADWKGEKAFEITDSVLRSNPDIKLIYAHNDIMAISASKAAKALGRDDITIIGTDGAPGLGIKAVADSLIDATFIYPTVGDRVVATAIDILEGKKHPHVEHIPSQSFIDRTNADMYIKQNDLLRAKTNQIGMLNEKYTLIKDYNASQKVLLVVSVIALLLLTAGLTFLLFYLRQKSRFQKELLEKNLRLTESGEKQAQLYSQLQEATQAKLVFFTNISHDLLTPLLLIEEPLKRITSSDELYGENRKLLSMVCRNAGSLKRMIEQILDFRRYENGKDSLKLREKDAVKKISHWSERFNDLAESKDIKFVTDIVSEGYTMAVDTDKLERIFFNLLSNAFKYTPKGGKVKVTCRMNQFKFFLIVSDSGSGMSPEERSKIFDRYYRIEGSSIEGTGIGLALTKAFVEMMKGNITVESNPGAGSTFTVTLPVRHIEADTNTDNDDDNDESRGNEEREIIIENGRENISDEMIATTKTDGTPTTPESEPPLLLIIDDNEDIRNWVKTISQQNYNVIEAKDGKEGLKKAVKYVPDVIVCDIMMPGIDGLEVTRRLKEEKTTSHIPLLILTASKIDEQRVKSYDSGADGFLSKPFTTELFLSRCRSLIYNRKKIFDLFLENAYNLRESHPARQNPDASTAPLPIDDEFYQQFLSIVKENIQDENLSVREIASRLGLGATQLTRKIKALTNNTPIEIIRRIRMRTARNLLLTTSRTVAEIAYSVGFSSSQYFARCFKEEFGITPTDLRSGIK